MKPAWFLLGATSLLAVGFGSVAWAAQSSDAQAGDLERGQKLAKAWCASCHAVEPGAQPPFAGVPSFRDVARLPSTTAASLHAFLATPHGGDMPAVKLNGDELDAIVTYVLSLKQR